MLAPTPYYSYYLLSVFLIFLYAFIREYISCIAMTAKNPPNSFLSNSTFIFIEIFAPITAPTIPADANHIPIFQSINFSFIDTIIAVIDVGTKNTKFVACAMCWSIPHKK